jgi:chromosome segregation protein
MTGGSIQQRSNQLSFGVSRDDDEAEPLRRRLLELGDTLVASRRQEASLAKELEELRPQLGQLEQRRAALEAERAAAQRSHAPLLERHQQLAARLTTIQASLASDGERQAAVAALLQPLRADLEALETAEAEARSSGDSDRWQGLQQDLEAADRGLSEARLRCDGLLNAQRERSLSAERLQSQLDALTGDEQRLVVAVQTLVAERNQWKQQQQADQDKRTELEARQKELQERFGARRRARDGAEARLSLQRQALQQQEWELTRLGEERLALAEQERSSALRLDRIGPRAARPPSRAARGAAAGRT